MPNEFVAKNGIIAQNNSVVSGSLIVTNGITGSLFGTSSQAVSASFAVNYLGSGSISTRLTNTETTASNLVAASSSFSTRITSDSSSFSSRVSSLEATTASLQVASSSFSIRITNTETTASNLVAASSSFSSRVSSIEATTASLQVASGSFSTRVTQIERTYATTGSNIYTGSQNILGAVTASAALINGTLTAQTLVVTTVSSSVVFSSGSNIFGNSTANTQTMTGSLNVSGSATIIGRVTATNLTGSLFGTASWATNFITSSVTSASYAFTASSATSASFASTASSINTLVQPVLISGSFTVVTGSSIEFQVTNTGIKIGNLLTDSHNLTGSLTVLGSITGSLSGSITGSLFGTASWATNFITGSVTSASFAFTASSAISASFASTASFVNTLNQNVVITGSLTIGTGSGNSVGENTLTIGPAGAGGSGEGGQLLLMAKGDGFTSASMLDNYQNKFRVLRGTNAGSDGFKLQVDLHTGQVQIPNYNSSVAFPGTVAANLAVDSNGNVLTVAAGTVVSASYAFTASSATNAFQAVSASFATTASTATTVVATVAGTNTTELVRGNMADNDQFRILVGGTATNAGYVEIATADDGTEPIHVRQYTGVFASLVRTATLLDGSGNTSFPGTVSATFSGNLTGTASFASNYLGSGSISTRLTNLETASANLTTASGSFSIRVTNTETTASSLVAASASFSTRITSDSSSFSSRVSSIEATTASLQVASGSFSTRVTQIERTYATTGSNIYTGSQNILGAITASAALINGTLTAQTLVVTTVSSSVVFSSGSNIFGNSTANTQTMTGSLNVSGSATIIGRVTATNLTGSLFGTASQATSASYSYTASSAISASYALTASFALNGGGGVSFPYTGSAQITGSLGVTGSFSVSANQGSSVFSSNADTLLITGSLIITGSGAAITGSLNVSNGITGSLFGTASQAITASYALTASYVASIAGLSTSQIATGSVTASVGQSTASFQLVSGSTNFLYVSNSGNVGINNAAPSLLSGGNGLSVSGSSYTQLQLKGAAAGGIEFVPSTGDTWEIQAANATVTPNSFIIYNRSDNAYRFLIDGSGNVAIGGSTRPSASLDVSGSVRYTNGLSGTGSVNISGSLTVTGSITTNGTITAQTLVVQTITSSITYSSGSNIFGNTLTDTQTMTGSVNITGSMTLRGNQTVFGVVTVQSASFDYGQNLSVATGSYQVIASEATSSFRCAFFDYVMFSGSIVRAGTVTSTWSGSATEYYENYTADLGGSTSGVQLQTAISAGNIQLQATASSPAWTIRSLIRLL